MARVWAGFNPLPARRPGATQALRPTHSGEAVSILSQPEGRELPERLEKITAEGKFQSSPSPKAGSYGFCCIRWETVACFNPLPARRPGATITVPTKDDIHRVSILSQPEGRELRRMTEAQTLLTTFQSSPSPKAGSYKVPNLSNTL